MKNYDGRLSDLISYLCEKNGINPIDFSSKENALKLVEHQRDITELREIIKYIKDYAKMKAVAQSIGDTEGLESDIDEAVSKLLQQIEEIKEKIKILPRKKSIKVSTEGLFGFEEEIAKQKIKTIETYNAQIDAQKQALKDSIDSLKRKIKELNTLKKNLGSPSGIMKALFKDEQYSRAEDYSRLVNLCATTITDGFYGKELIGENGVFSYDKNTEQYSVNKANAKKFIQLLKKKKDLFSAAEYVKISKKFSDREAERSRLSDNIAVLDKAKELSETAEFKFIHDSINKLIIEYNDLLHKEFLDAGGNPFKRVYRSFLASIGLSILANKPSGTVRKSRIALEKNVRALLGKVNGNKKYKETYEVYVRARGSVIGQEALSLNNMLLASHNISEGYGRYELPKKTIEMDELMSEMAIEKNSLAGQLNEEKEESDRINEMLIQAQSELSPSAQSIVSQYSPDLILDMVRKYYTPENEKRLNPNGRIALSNTSALMILEGILSKRNISFEKMCEHYATILGERGVQEERVDLDRLMSEKLGSLKSKISSLVGDIAEEIKTAQPEQTDTRDEDLGDETSQIGLGKLDIKTAPMELVPIKEKEM